MRGDYTDYGALSGAVYELCALFAGRGENYLRALDKDPQAVAARLRRLAATMDEEQPRE